MKILGVVSKGLGLSGKGNSIFFGTLGKIHDVRTLIVEFSGLDFLAVSMYAFSPHPYLDEKFPLSFFPYQKNAWSFMRRTKIFECNIDKLAWKPDLILEIGTSFSPLTRKKAYPYVSYIDSTSKMSDKEYPPWSRFRSETAKTHWMSLQQTLFSGAFRVFTMSGYTRKSVIEDFHEPPHKVSTVYAGPNLDKLPLFEKDTSNKMILFVGGDFNRKGGIVLLRAFKEVTKRIKNARLFIAGCRPRISYPGIWIKGFVKEEELLQLYKDASIFVMPSIYEPFGHAFLEAMAYKNPCIGSNKGAMLEIIKNGGTGFTTPPYDHMKLAETMIYLLEDENLMRKMGEEGRRKIETSFNWNTVAKKITRELESLTET